MLSARLRPLAFALLTGCASPCGGEPPPEFDRLRADLSGEKTVIIVLSWPDPELPTTHEVTVRLRPDEARASARMGSVYTDGTGAWLDGDFKVPLLDLADEAEELFGELRSGLAGARWTPIEAPRIGAVRPAADAVWAEVDLPFDWMDGETVLLAVDRETGALRYAAIETNQPPLQVTARPPRGAPQTVTLSTGTQLGLAVRDYQVR
jgi:hypothetical protein